jgi:hypothetical protein
MPYHSEERNFFHEIQIQTFIEKLAPSGQCGFIKTAQDTPQLAKGRNAQM